jgi:hypothetical protein
MSDELAKKILVEATRCVSDRNWELAVNAFERLARVRPLDPKVIYNKGVAYTRLMRFSEAKADFVRAIELENSYVLARNSYKEICQELSEIPNPLLMPNEEPIKDIIQEETSVISNVITEEVPSIDIINEPPTAVFIDEPEEKQEIDWDKFEADGAITIGSPAGNAMPVDDESLLTDIPVVSVSPAPEFNIFDDGIETSNVVTGFEGESSFIFDNNEETIVEKKDPINDFIISSVDGISFNIDDNNATSNDIVEFKTPLETNNLDFLPSEDEISSPMSFNNNLPEPETKEFKTPLETVNLDFIPVQPEVVHVEEPVITPFQFEEAPSPLQINDNDDDDENEGKGRKIIFDLDA